MIQKIELLQDSLKYMMGIRDYLIEKADINHIHHFCYLDKKILEYVTEIAQYKPEEIKRVKKIPRV